MGFLDHFLNPETTLLALAKIQGGLASASVTGRTFWVDSSDGDASDSDGRGTFSEPFETIDYAVSKCTASRGDVILVKPGHTETITTAAGIDIDVKGVTVKGLGWSTFRPTITIGATGAYVELGGTGCRIENCIITTGIAAVTKALVLNGTGCIVSDCEFRIGDAAYHALNAITVNTEDCIVDGVRVLYGSASTASTHAIDLNASRTTIQRCYISGNFTASAIDGISAAYTDAIIVGNGIINSQTTAIDGIIDLSANTTGIIAHNFGKHGNTASLGNCIDPASCAACENYFQNADGESGGIAPATRST